MNLGGPVWHVSIAPLGTRVVPKRELERLARRVLRGRGDPDAGEWVEGENRVIHLRRRLTAREAEPIGPVVDVRGTPEARSRITIVLNALGPVADQIPPDILHEEMHGP